MSAEEVRTREAADRAYRIQEGEKPNPALSGDRMLELLKDATRRAPLPRHLRAAQKEGLEDFYARTDELGP